MKNFKTILFNSAVLFMLAWVLQTTLHECGHFIAGILVHAKRVVLHHNYVSNSEAEMPLRYAMFMAGAGPLVSLTIGLVFHFICARWQKRNLFFLFCLYMSVFGYIAFFGYLIIAPFFTYGDTGYIFQALRLPLWVTILIAVLNALLLYVLMLRMIRYFVEIGTVEIISDKNLRRSFMNTLVRYPLFIGVVGTALLNLPAPSLLSLIYPLCSSFCIMWAFRSGISKQYQVDNLNADLNSVNTIRSTWIVAFILMIIVNRLLVHGVAGN